MKKSRLKYPHNPKHRLSTIEFLNWMVGVEFKDGLYSPSIGCPFCSSSSRSFLVVMDPIRGEVGTFRCFECNATGQTPEHYLQLRFGFSKAQSQDWLVQNGWCTDE